MDPELGRPGRALIKTRADHEFSEDDDDSVMPCAARARYATAPRRTNFVNIPLESLFNILAFLQPSQYTGQGMGHPISTFAVSKVFVRAAAVPQHQKTTQQTKNLQPVQVLAQDAAIPPPVPQTSPLRRRRKLATTRLGHSVNLRDQREIDHDQRKEDIAALLGSVVNRDHTEYSHVFLCWGRRDQCHILATRIPNTADEVEIWRTVNYAWYANADRWRRLLPIFGVKSISCARVAIAGKTKGRAICSLDHVSLTGVFDQTDITKEKARCERLIRSSKVYYDDPCHYNAATGVTDHGSECIADGVWEFHECPYEERQEAQRQLLRLKMQPFLKSAFSDPELAACNDLIKDNHLIYNHQSLLQMLDEWHCPRIGELQFNALYIDTKRTYREIMLPVSVLALVIAVPLARLVFGEWGNALAAGGIFATFAGILLSYHQK